MKSCPFIFITPACLPQLYMLLYFPEWIVDSHPAVGWIVETNLPSCSHCKASCTLLYMAHSFLHVLMSSTSSGDLVVPGNIVGVLTLLRQLCSCNFHHHDAILVDILWHCSHCYIHSMQLPEQPCAAVPANSTLPLSCSYSMRCSDPIDCVCVSKCSWETLLNYKVPVHARKL